MIVEAQQVGDSVAGWGGAPPLPVPHHSPHTNSFFTPRPMAATLLSSAKGPMGGKHPQPSSRAHLLVHCKGHFSGRVLQPTSEEGLASFPGPVASCPLGALITHFRKAFLWSTLTPLLKATPSPSLIKLHLKHILSWMGIGPGLILPAQPQTITICKGLSRLL